MTDNAESAASTNKSVTQESGTHESETQESETQESEIQTDKKINTKKKKYNIMIKEAVLELRELQLQQGDELSDCK